MVIQLDRLKNFNRFINDMSQEVKATDKEVGDKILTALIRAYHEGSYFLKAAQIKEYGGLSYDLQTIIGPALRLLCLEEKLVKSREGYKLTRRGIDYCYHSFF